MKTRTLIIGMTLLILLGCLPKADKVTMRNPTTGETKMCLALEQDIDSCIDSYSKKGWKVKSVVFQDE